MGAMDRLHLFRGVRVDRHPPHCIYLSIPTLRVLRALGHDGEIATEMAVLSLGLAACWFGPSRGTSYILIQ